LCADDFVVPERANGTLRAYRGHHSSRELLACPGDQDLTAHVNFTVLQTAGESEGLMTDKVMTQAEFLIRILERITSQSAQAAEFGFATAEKRRQLQTLTHPEHLGRPLKVLVQARA
jgi:SAM-dependent MidA family methyltransferase